MLRTLPCRTYLTKNLAFADDRRIQAGSHFKQVTDGSIVVLAIDMGCQFFGGKSTKFAKEIAKIAVGPVKFLGNCIHLSAITC